MASYTRWYGPEVYTKIQQRERQRMERAVRHLRNSIVRSISIKGPPPSAPGEPPHIGAPPPRKKRRKAGSPAGRRYLGGNLRRSIATEVLYRGTMIIGRVGTNVRYAPFLELGTSRMAARPFLVPALRRERRVIARLLVGQKF